MRNRISPGVCQPCVAVAFVDGSVTSRPKQRGDDSHQVALWRNGARQQFAGRRRAGPAWTSTCRRDGQRSQPPALSSSVCPPGGVLPSAPLHGTLHRIGPRLRFRERFCASRASRGPGAEWQSPRSPRTPPSSVLFDMQHRPRCPPTAALYPPTAAGHPPTAVGYPSTAAGHPPTAVSYLSTAVSYPSTAVGYPPTAAGHPPTAVSYPSTAVGRPPTPDPTVPHVSGVPFAGDGPGGSQCSGRGRPERREEGAPGQSPSHPVSPGPARRRAGGGGQRGPRHRPRGGGDGPGGAPRRVPEVRRGAEGVPDAGPDAAVLLAPGRLRPGHRGPRDRAGPPPHDELHRRAEVGPHHVRPVQHHHVVLHAECLSPGRWANGGRWGWGGGACITEQRTGRGQCLMRLSAPSGHSAKGSPLPPSVPGQRGHICAPAVAVSTRERAHAACTPAPSAPKDPKPEDRQQEQHK